MEGEAGRVRIVILQICGLRACVRVCVMRVGGGGGSFGQRGARRREQLMVLATDWRKVDGSDRKMKGGATRWWILGDQGFAPCVLGCCNELSA